MTDQTYQRASYIANQINRGVTKTGRKIMIIASCDFSHYLPPDKGRELDQIILDRILKHDAPGVEKAVVENHLSVCGFGPVMSLMEYARSKSADYKIEILARGHSGEVSPSPEVVDYISLMFYT
jgi:hypothetical protein